MKKREALLEKKAAALQYSAKDVSPVLTAKGSGRVAEKILALAKEHDIPVQEDPDLLYLLSKLDLNDHIPPDLYQVVAEVLAYVYSVNKRHTK
ncbi:MAG: EscU/YscU/HrcU family type III secretion system export apparatus switch protein [Nitrospinota bacterium]